MTLYLPTLRRINERVIAFIDARPTLSSLFRRWAVKYDAQMNFRRLGTHSPSPFTCL